MSGPQAGGGGDYNGSLAPELAAGIQRVKSQNASRAPRKLVSQKEAKRG
jgi:hypothetical protein